MQPQNSSSDSKITIELGNKNVLRLRAKIATIVLLSIPMGFAAPYAARQNVADAEKIAEFCSEVTCIDEVLDYQDRLSDTTTQLYKNPLMAILFTMLSFAFMAGFYELAVLCIELLIRKIIR